jgi:predicted transcriptional regulator
MSTAKANNKPHRLFDFLIERFGIKSDYQLAQLLEVGPSAVSKFRSGRPVTANLILKVHETFEVPIKDIKALL